MTYQEALNVFELKEGYTKDELKKQYRKLSIKYHPDKNQGDEKASEKMSEINNAYEILQDPDKHKNKHQIDQDEFFNRFNRRGGYQQRRPKGQTIIVDIPITLEEMFNGGDKEIKFNVQHVCNTCQGNGGLEFETCHTCSGHGFVQERLGQFITRSTCHTCYGSGKHVKTDCNTCKNQGYVPFEKTTSIKIPAGVNINSRMVLRGEGSQVKNGDDGDILFQIQVKPHEIFILNGLNIEYNLPVDFFKLILGTSIEIPTIDGTVSFKIPEMCQPDKIFRLVNKGMLDGETKIRGHMFVNIKPTLPENLTPEQIEILKSFKK